MQGNKMADFKLNPSSHLGTGLGAETSYSSKIMTKKKLPPLRSGLVRKPKNISNESLPMVILVPSDTECMSKYAIPLENAETGNDADSVMKIIEMLNSVNQNVRDLEDMYDSTEEKNALDGDLLSSFLSFCNRNSSELSSSIQEEHEILESLLKWFETELQMLEEPDEEDDLSHPERLPAPCTVEAEVLRMKEGLKRLTRLKDRFRELPKLVRAPILKGEKKKKGVHGPAVVKSTTKDIDFDREFEEVEAILRNLQSESPFQSAEIKQKLMQELSKLFQKQSTKLQKLEKDHGDVQTKYSKIKTDVQVLSEANVVMEKELKKMKGQRNLKQEELPTEEGVIKETKKKTPKKSAKEKKGTGTPSELPSTAEQDEEGHQKVLEELVVAKRKTTDLQQEKRDLENKLQNALKEAAKAKEELKIFRSVAKSPDTAKPAAVDTVTTKSIKSIMKRPDSSTPPTELPVLKQSLSEDFLKIKPSRSESKISTGTPVKTPEFRMSDAEETLIQESESVELQKRKDTSSVIKKVLHDLPAATVGKQDGRQPSMHPKVMRGEAGAEGMIASDGKKLVPLKMTEEERKIYDMAKTSPLQQMYKETALQTESQEDFPSKVYIMVDKTSSTADLLIGMEREIYAAGFQERLAPDAFPTLPFPVSPKILPADATQLSLFDKSKRAAEWETDKEGRLIQTREQAQMMQQAAKWETDQREYFVQAQQRQGVPGQVPDQRYLTAEQQQKMRGILGQVPDQRLLTTEQQQMMQGILGQVPDQRLLTTEQQQMMQGILGQVPDQRLLTTEQQQMMRGILGQVPDHRLLTTEQQQMMRGILGQVPDHRLLTTEQQQMMRGILGQVPDHRLLTTEQQQMMRGMPGQVPDQRLLTTEQQQMMRGMPGQVPDQRLLTTEQQQMMRGMPGQVPDQRLLTTEQQQMMRGIPGQVPDQRLLTTEQQQMIGGKPGQVLDQRVLTTEQQQWLQMQRMLGQVTDQRALTTELQPGGGLVPGQVLDQMFLIAEEQQKLRGMPRQFLDQRFLTKEQQEKLLGQEFDQPSDLQQKLSRLTSLHREPSRLPYQLLKRDQMIRFQPSKFFSPFGRSQLTDAIFSKSLAARMRYDQLLITGRGLKQQSDRQVGSMIFQQRPRRWFLPYSIQMLQLFFPFYNEEIMQTNQMYGRSLFRRYRGTVFHRTRDIKKYLKAQLRGNVPYSDIDPLETLIKIGPNIRHLALNSRTQADHRKKSVSSTVTTSQLRSLPEMFPRFYKTPVVHQDFVPKKLSPTKSSSVFVKGTKKEIFRALGTIPSIKWDPDLFTRTSYSKQALQEKQSKFNAKNL
uniref:Coiled-coil domain-containing protein 7 isoform X2 n=1 Tax=Geotrypetes seraphini TaxID=260995 RepID=A0A6P8PY76_GEOSA|nr:coiled-coil domain-containing protein 7 isoform X2 [Geotrypetes seraphini]XP_033787385.1 coiled-coil domain-containing protein 7 isoform X2 [Geotrypetes seraphini]